MPKTPAGAANDDAQSFRSTIFSQYSRKHRQTLEEHLAQTFGGQFCDLVLQLKNESIAEENTENLADRAIEKKGSSAQEFKLMQERDDRFRENRAVLDDEDGYEMPEPSV